MIKCCWNKHIAGMTEVHRDKPIFAIRLPMQFSCVQSGGDAKTRGLWFRVLEAQRQQTTASSSTSAHMSLGLGNVHSGTTLRAMADAAAGASSSGNAAEKVYHFEITDEADNFFLYVLDLGDIDFHALKREQSILVDLPAFPDKLAALLKLCSAAGASGAAESSRPTISQFTARLDGSSGLFSIVESNEFKNLTHISLQMRPANDAALKSYLSSRLLLSTNLSLEQAKKINDLENAIADVNCRLAVVCEELNEARNRLSHDSITSEAAHTKEVSELRASSAAALQRAQAEAEERVAALRAQLDSTSTELRTEVASLRKELSSNLESKTSLEYHVKELDRDARSLAADRDRFKIQADSLSEDLRKRDAALMVLERDNSSLKTKVEGMQQLLADKDEMIARSAALHRAAEVAKAEADERTDQYRGAVEALQAKLAKASEEINKGNQIIRANAKEIEDLREKIRNKNDVIRKQENASNDLRGQLGEFRVRLKAEEDARAADRAVSARLKEDLDNAQRKIKELLASIEERESINSYLNTMVTQLQTGSVKGGESANNASWYSPSAIGNGSRSTRGIDFSSSRTPGGAGPEVSGDSSSFGHQVVFSAAGGGGRGAFASPDGLADLMHHSSPLDFGGASDLTRMNKMPAASSLLASKSSASGAAAGHMGATSSPKYFWQQEDFAVIDES